MAAFAGVEQIVANHRIEPDSCDLHAMVLQDEHVVLDVLIDGGTSGVFDNRFQGVQNLGPIQRLGTARPIHRNVVPDTRLPAEGPADDLGLHRIEAGRFEIDAELALLLELGKKLLELLFGVDDLPIASRDLCRSLG